MLSLSRISNAPNSFHANVSRLLRSGARTLGGLLLFAAFAATASAHSASLSWVKSTDDTGATGSGYTVWRSSGACPAQAPTTTAGFTAVNSTLVSGTSYTDSTVTPGDYCYIVTFTENAAVSADSNDAAAVILPAAPTSVTITGSN